MSVIHVRSVSEDLVARLQARARGHHRSMEAEVRAILAEAMEPVPMYGVMRHVNFDLIAKTDLGDVVFEPMSPSLHAVEL